MGDWNFGNARIRPKAEARDHARITLAAPRRGTTLIDKLDSTRLS